MIQRLLDEPYRFQFAQAVRLLDLWLRREGVEHDQVLTRYLRFKNSLSLSFPPSQIEALVPEADVPIGTAAALQAAVRGGRLRHIHITPAFMGLLGVHGALPLRYTEGVAMRVILKKDEGPRALFDCFSTRSLALFHQAWSACRIEYRVDARGRDAFLRTQLALAGVRPAPAAPPAGAMCDEVPAHYAAVLRHRPASAALIEGVLSEYFGVPFEVRQFIGGWDRLPPALQTRLGVNNCVLGHDAILGERRWRRDLRVRLRIGPLALADYRRFFPDTSATAALRAMVALFAVAGLIYEVQLVLRARDVQAIVLSAQGTGARLGWDTFLCSETETRDRDDVCFELYRPVAARLSS